MSENVSKKDWKKKTEKKSGKKTQSKPYIVTHWHATLNTHWHATLNITDCSYIIVIYFNFKIYKVTSRLRTVMSSGTISTDDSLLFCLNIIPIFNPFMLCWNFPIAILKFN